MATRETFSLFDLAICAASARPTATSGGSAGSMAAAKTTTDANLSWRLMWESCGGRLGPERVDTLLALAGSASVWQRSLVPFRGNVTISGFLPLAAVQS